MSEINEVGIQYGMKINIKKTVIVTLRSIEQRRHLLWTVIHLATSSIIVAPLTS